MDWSATEIEIEGALLPVSIEVYLLRLRVIEAAKKLTPAWKGCGAAASEAADAMRRFNEAVAPPN